MGGEGVTLEEYVSEQLRGSNKRYRVLLTTYRAVSKGEILLRDRDPPNTFVEYICRLDHSLWFWIIMVLITATSLSVIAVNPPAYVQYIRYVLGALYVLFLPGYVTIEALYPGPHELKPLERLALSIGFSLAIVPLMGLALNYASLGIDIMSALIATSAYIIAMSLAAAKRKYRLLNKQAQPAV